MKWQLASLRAGTQRAEQKCQPFPNLITKQPSITLAMFCTLEPSPHMQQTLKGSGIGELYLWKGGVSKNLWAYFLSHHNSKQLSTFLFQDIYIQTVSVPLDSLRPSQMLDSLTDLSSKVLSNIM